MRRILIPLAVVASLVTASVALAGPPTGGGRYDLVAYDPPRFQIDVWLGKPNSATIEFDGRAFVVTTEFNRAMPADTLTVLADAIDFAVKLAEAMPQ